MHDAIVIGAGPNGMVAAATLARQGWSVLLLEAQARPGGALYSEPLTLEGFLHDVGAAFFPFADFSPALASLDLSGVGLQWRNAECESSHPALDGTCPTICRDVGHSMTSFGIDGQAWQRLARRQEQMGGRLVSTLLAPLPSIGPAWRLGPGHLLWLGWAGMRSTANLGRRLFRSVAGQRVLPSLGLHVDLGPHDWTGAGLGLVLALLASSSGFRIPFGGARAITEAMLRRFTEAGGELQLNTHVNRIVTRGRRAVAVRTTGGEEIPVRKAVLADVGAPALYQRLLPAQTVPAYLAKSIGRFRYGWGTFKMDWALSGAVPWTAADARRAAVVHTGESVADLQGFTLEVRSGQLPSNPYLVIGQQSLVDPGRAPPGSQTLWAYTHVPSNLAGGWTSQRDFFADRIERRIEGLAPGFRSLIRARAISAPPDLETMDENLVGGDLGGGSAQWDQQLFFRPAFPYFRHRTPVRGVYLCSASSNPGAGVHGACGFNAAQQALADRL